MSNNYASFFVALTAGILYGLSMSIVSGTNLEVPWNEWQSKAPIVTGLIASAYLIGAAVGSFFGGFISDRFGPKKVLAASCVMSLAASVCIAIQLPLLPLLIVFRIMTGLGIGVICSIGPLYISEQADPKRRGMLGSLFQLFVCTGQLLAFLINFAFQNDHSEAWRFEFLLAGSVLPIVFLIGFPLLPESAGYLSQQKGLGVAGGNPRVNINTDVEGGALTSGGPDQEGSVPSKSFFDDLKAMGAAALSSKRAFVIGIVLAILQQITGINAIMFFSPSIFATFSPWFAEQDHLVVGSLIVGGWNLISVVVAFGLVDRLGRKPLLLVGWALMTVGNVLMFIVDLIPALKEKVLQFGLPGLIAFLFGFQIGPGPIFFVVVSELYDVAIRGRAMGLIVMFNWLFNVAVTLTFPYLQQVMKKKVFIIFAITSALAVLFVIFFVYETKGRTLTSPGGAEEQHLREEEEESEYLSGGSQPSYSQ